MNARRANTDAYTLVPDCLASPVPPLCVVSQERPACRREALHSPHSYDASESLSLRLIEGLPDKSHNSRPRATGRCRSPRSDTTTVAADARHLFAQGVIR